MPRYARRTSRRRPATRKRVMRRKRRITKRKGVYRKLRRTSTRGRKRYVSGRGAYSFSSSRIAQTVPQFGAGGEGVTYLSNREQVGLVKSPAGYDGNFKLAKLSFGENADSTKDIDAYLRMNPGSHRLLRWGAGIVEKYEQYKLMGFIFHYEPLINTQNSVMTSIPEIVMSSNDNPFLYAPISAESMKIQPLSAFARVDRPLTAGIECHPARTSSGGWKWVVPIDVNGAIQSDGKWSSQNLQDTDYGTFAIGLSGGAPKANIENVVLGRLYVSYKIQLMRPISGVQAGFEIPPLPEGPDALAAEKVRRSIRAQGGGAKTSESSRGAIGQSNEVSTGNGAYTIVNDEVSTYNNENHPAAADMVSIHYHEYEPLGKISTATKYDTNYGWDTPSSATNGRGPGIFRYTATDALTGSVNPPAGVSMFDGGALVTKAVDPSLAGNNPPLQVYESMIDSIGIRMSLETNNTVRLFFLKRPRNGAVYKVSVKWSGMVHIRQNGPVPPCSAAANAHKLWVHAAKPQMYISSKQHFEEWPSDLEMPDCQTVTGQTRANFAAFRDARGQHVALPSDYTTGPGYQNVLTLTGPKANLHSTVAGYINQDTFYYETYMVYNGADSETLPMIELPPLRCWGCRVYSSLSSGSNSNFVTVFPANSASVPVWENGTTSANTGFPTPTDPVRYGARSIEIRETTYHELPRQYHVEMMDQRRSMYEYKQAVEMNDNASKPRVIVNGTTDYVYKQ